MAHRGAAHEPRRALVEYDSPLSYRVWSLDVKPRDRWWNNVLDVLRRVAAVIGRVFSYAAQILFAAIS